MNESGTPGAYRLRRILSAEKEGLLPMDKSRTLTDADVDAIVKAFEDKFYSNLGKSIWSKAWMVIAGGILALAGWNIWPKH